MPNDRIEGRASFTRPTRVFCEHTRMTYMPFDTCRNDTSCAASIFCLTGGGQLVSSIRLPGTSYIPDPSGGYLRHCSNDAGFHKLTRIPSSRDSQPVLVRCCYQFRRTASDLEFRIVVRLLTSCLRHTTPAATKCWTNRGTSSCRHLWANADGDWQLTIAGVF